MQQLLALQPGTVNGGIYANKSGYHNTRAANQSSWPDNYSIRDAEDRGGPADKAAAYDWTFPDAQGGNYTTIAKYSRRLLDSGRDAGDPRLNGWREFFGQTDTDGEVEGWDFRRGRAASSDSSHLWHIHLSEDRDKVTDLENKKAVLSVLRGETVAQWRAGSGRTLTGRLADINGDGRVDLLARFPDGNLFVYPGTGKSGTETFGERYQVGIGWNEATAITVADVNGDGRVDLLARFPDGNLFVYPGTGKSGTETFGERYQVGIGWNEATAVTVADVNGDGRVDLLARFPDGNLFVYPGTGKSGTETFGERYQVGIGWNDATAITVADVNGDGRADILARFPDGNLYVYPGTGRSGTETFGERYQVGIGWNDATAITVADINGDGRADLLARFPDGNLYVYPGTGKSGTETFGERYQVGTGWNVVTALT
ncbi:hypothetical protein BJY16_004915 [Actinoplanes octamycinicus]|uniref:VCBS repeat protein n=2 Tax=Actinoplanes octamycinicus TaxID=135948 RepID=A0A7W7GZZ8_9ACTN|nr:hypothetical protein [Actinoplanes octamycinicus]